MRNGFDGSPGENILLHVDAAAIRKAETHIESCEHCEPLAAISHRGRRFAAVFDRRTSIF